MRFSHRKVKPGTETPSASSPARIDADDQMRLVQRHFALAFADNLDPTPDPPGVTISSSYSVESEAERVEAGAEIGAGCRDPDP